MSWNLFKTNNLINSIIKKVKKKKEIKTNKKTNQILLSKTKEKNQHYYIDILVINYKLIQV